MKIKMASSLVSDIRMVLDREAFNSLLGSCWLVVTEELHNETDQVSQSEHRSSRFMMIFRTRIFPDAQDVLCRVVRSNFTLFT